MANALPTPDRPILLVGLMGAGKTTVGRLLAKRLGLGFVDSDEEVERAAGGSVTEIFERLGETAFRDEERRVLERLIVGGPRVIAAGGGAFSDSATRALALERCIAIWLDGDVATLADRAARDSRRPLLAGKDPVQVLSELAERRGPSLAEAQLRVASHSGSPERIVERIVEALAARAGPD
ncbi:MAG TPA: shikimate kinase [Allosphingosinicella sp.]|jgi:shikimate kinase